MKTMRNEIMKNFPSGRFDPLASPEAISPLARKAGFKINLILALSLIICIAFGCKKDSKKQILGSAPPPDFSRYLGTYELRPAAAKTILTLTKDGGVKIQRGKKLHAGSYLASRNLLRIFVSLPGETIRSGEPAGVFLLRDFNPKRWRGFWNGDMRRLIKIENAP